MLLIVVVGPPNKSGRADGNRKQRGYRSLTAKHVGRLMEVLGGEQ